MKKVTSFVRRATPADYQWSEELHAYTLRFDDRFRPGVVADSPVVGAAFYNRYLDRLPETLAANRTGVIRLRTFILALVDGEFARPFATLAIVWVLHIYNGKLYPDLTDAQRSQLLTLTDAERELLILAFSLREELLILLTPARVARLRLAL